MFSQLHLMHYNVCFFFLDCTKMEKNSKEEYFVQFPVV